MLLGFHEFWVEVLVIAIVIKPTYFILNQFWGVVDVQTVKSGACEDWSDL